MAKRIPPLDQSIVTGAIDLLRNLDPRHYKKVLRAIQIELIDTPNPKRRLIAGRLKNG